MKLLIWLAISGPVAWLGVAALSDRLGANPIETVTHVTGEWALRLLLATLCITPLRRLMGWRWLAPHRRTLGLACFFYATLHLLTYVVLDLYFDWETLVEDVIKRPYVTAGAVAYLCMLPLAVTSTRGWILRLGPRWTRLHRLVYVAGTAAIVHFAWGVKADLFEPAVYGALLAALFGLRWVIRERAKSKGQTMLGP